MGSIWRDFFGFVLGLLLFLSLPFILLLVLLPLATCRLGVAKLALFLRPDLSKILSTRGAALAIDPLYTRPRSNIVFGGVLEGALNLEQLTQLFCKLISSNEPKSGLLKYPELRQCLESWCGYFFWKDDQNFKIQNHMRLYKPKCEGGQVSEEEIETLTGNLINACWKKGQPLWEIVLVENYPHPNADQPHFMLILHVHHSLMDGFSVLILLLDLLRLYQPLVQVQPALPLPPPTRSSLSHFLHFLRLPFQLSQALLEMSIGEVPFRSKNNVWSKMRDLEEGMGVGFQMALSPPILLSTIHHIKNHFEVSFTAVLLSAFTGALTDLLAGQQDPQPQIMLLPSSIIIPMHNHSHKLRNYLTLGILRLPLGLSQPLERLQFCHQDYQRLVQSTIPLAFRFLFPMGGLLPYPILSLVFYFTNTVPCGITNFPGPKFSLEGAPPCLVDMFFANGLLPGNCGVGMSVLSLSQHLRFSVVGDKSVLGVGETERLKGLMLHHIQLLNQLTFKD